MRDLLGENRPMVRVNNWLVLHELVRAGVGVTVLPCCFGDADPLLLRLTEVLPDVSADQFLLVHRDRHSAAHSCDHGRLGAVVPAAAARAARSAAIWFIRRAFLIDGHCTKWRLSCNSFAGEESLVGLTEGGGVH